MVRAARPQLQEWNKFASTVTRPDYPQLPHSVLRCRSSQIDRPTRRRITRTPSAKSSRRWKGDVREVWPPFILSSFDHRVDAARQAANVAVLSACLAVRRVADVYQAFSSWRRGSRAPSNCVTVQARHIEELRDALSGGTAINIPLAASNTPTGQWRPRDTARYCNRPAILVQRLDLTRVVVVPGGRPRSTGWPASTGHDLRLGFIALSLKAALTLPRLSSRARCRGLVSQTILGRVRAEPLFQLLVAEAPADVAGGAPPGRVLAGAGSSHSVRRLVVKSAYELARSRSCVQE